MSELEPSLPDDGDDDIEKAETFLGGLRSELDEGSHLHPSFASLAAAADAIRASYLAFGITPQRAAEAFKMLRIVDDNDIEWTVGPSSGTWYRRREGSPTWQAGPAPLMAEPRHGQAEPWLSSELGELLPSARTSSKPTPEARAGNQAGIRVVDVTTASPELERESSDWLLSEWDALETELEHLQASARPSVSIEDSAAWPVKQMFEKAVKPELQQDRPETLGLPEPADVNEPVPDLFDLFVKPDAPADRQGAVTEADLTGQAPAVRSITTPEVEQAAELNSEQGVLTPDPGTFSPDSWAGGPEVVMDPVAEQLDVPNPVPETPGVTPYVNIPGELSPDQREHAEPASDDDPYGIGR